MLLFYALLFASRLSVILAFTCNFDLMTCLGFSGFAHCSPLGVSPILFVVVVGVFGGRTPNIP